MFVYILVRLMARYLLDAPDDEMTAWKKAAAKAGVSFAEWLRGAARSKLPAATVPARPQADDRGGSGKSPLAEKQAAREGNQRPGGGVEPVPAPSTVADRMQGARVALDRRQVTPIPRPGKKR